MHYPFPKRGKTRRKFAGLVAVSAVVATGAAGAGVALAAGPTLPTYTDSAYALPSGLPATIQTALSTNAPTDVVYSADDSTAYVANGTGNLYVIPLATPASATTITLHAGELASDLAVAPNGSSLYAPATAANTVAIVSLASGNAETDVTVTAPTDVVASPDGNWLYADSATAVSAINLSSHAVGTVADAHSYLTGAHASPSSLAVSPDGSKLYIAGAYDAGYNGGAGSAGVAVANVSTISRLGDPNAGTVSDFIPDPNAGAAGLTAGLAVSPDGDTLFIGDEHGTSGANGTTVSIADISGVSGDASNDSVVGSFTGSSVAFNAPNTLALTPNGGTLTVFSSGSTADVTIPSAVTARPKAGGTKKVGGTVTATATAASGTAPGNVTLSYQWYAGGVAISGATSKSFKLTTAQYGKKIQVAVTSVGAVGYSEAPFVSYNTSAVGKGKITTHPVRLTGSALVGKTLTANFKGWTPSPTMRYVWYANGKQVKSGTGKSGKTLKLTGAELFKKVSVKVTGTKTDYTTASKTSATKTVV